MARHKPVNRIIRGITYPIIFGWILSKLYVSWVGEDFHTDHVLNLIRPLWQSTPVVSRGEIDFNAGVWQYRGEKNGLKTFSKAVPGSALLALRGTGVLNMHVSTAVGTFLDANRCYLWVDMLDLMYEMLYDPKTAIYSSGQGTGGDAEERFDEAQSAVKKADGTKRKSKTNAIKGLFKKFTGARDYGTKGATKGVDASIVSVEISDLSKDLAKEAMKRRENSWSREISQIRKRGLPSRSDFKFRDLVYQRLKLPWPISPRELLIRRDWHFDEKDKKVLMKYKSIEDKRVSHTKGFIRAEAAHMLWQFEKRPPKAVVNAAGLTEYIDQTYVEVECFVDSKGSIPAWFINYLQGSWPTKVLREFQKLVDAAEGYEPWPGIVHW